MKEKLRFSYLKNLMGSPEVFLLITTGSGYAFSYIYFLIMGRILGPEEFGILGALFAIFYVATLVSQSLREGIATKVAEIKACNGEKECVAAYMKLAVRLEAICFIPCIALALFSWPIANYFKVGSVWPVVLLAFSVFAAFTFDIVLGLLQGLQKFKTLGVVGYTVAQGLKMTLGLAFVVIGWKLLGAVGSLLASSFLATLIGLAVIKKQLAGAIHSDSTPRLRLGPILMPTLILAIFLCMPASVDVMLVTHYFGGVDAGFYNAAATIGKVVIFLPMAVSMVLLPRATERNTLGKDTRGILLQSVGLTALFSGIIALLCWIFPDTIIQFFFGSEYAGAASLLGLYTVAMLLFSMDAVLIHYSLATRNLWLMVFADVVTAAEVLAIVLVHNTLSQIIMILFFGNILIFLVCFPLLAFRKQRHLVYDGSIR